jgi:hypothetical protein
MEDLIIPKMNMFIMMNLYSPINSNESYTDEIIRVEEYKNKVVEDKRENKSYPLYTKKNINLKRLQRSCSWSE